MPININRIIIDGKEYYFGVIPGRTIQPGITAYITVRGLDALASSTGLCLKTKLTGILSTNYGDIVLKLYVS